MTSRICKCCGEPMAEGRNDLSRNPSEYASCSSMADGMHESGTTECVDAPAQQMTDGTGTENGCWPRELASMLQ
jgi:hypothetical protein